MSKLRVVLAALAITALGALWGWLTCGHFFNWVYQLPPVSVWRAPADMTPLFWTISVLGDFVLSIIFTCVLGWIARGVPGKWLVKGLAYGLIVWLVGVLPGAFATGMFMSVNVVWPIYMALNELVILPIMGLVAAAIALPRSPQAAPTE